MDGRTRVSDTYVITQCFGTDRLQNSSAISFWMTCLNILHLRISALQYQVKNNRKFTDSSAQKVIAVAF